jgi:hypothetical protein
MAVCLHRVTTFFCVQILRLMSQQSSQQDYPLVLMTSAAISVIIAWVII